MMRQILQLFLLSIIAGCSFSLGKNDLPSSYRFISGNLKQEISISANGNYSNVFYREGVVVWSDQSKWEYENHAGDFGVVFANFRFGFEERSDLIGYWFVVPEKNFTGVKKLCFDPDLNQCFETH
jgi:hypothetical protein